MRFQFIGRLNRKLFGLKFTVIGLLGAAIVGAVGIVAFNAAIVWTNTEAFCISCHEMRDFVYEEYKETIHYNNRSGVRAICSDCHVPRETLPKLWRKIRATGELYGKITGKISTREKFEAHRYELALRVWTTMKKNDSLECRNCHDENPMSEETQTKKAWARHSKAKVDKKTCIDCHFSIAHEEPEGELGPQDIIIER